MFRNIIMLDKKNNQHGFTPRFSHTHTHAKEIKGKKKYKLYFKVRDLYYYISSISCIAQGERKISLVWVAMNKMKPTHVLCNVLEHNRINKIKPSHVLCNVLEHHNTSSINQIKPSHHSDVRLLCNVLEFNTINQIKPSHLVCHVLEHNKINIVGLSLKLEDNIVSKKKKKKKKKNPLKLGDITQCSLTLR